MSDLIRKYDVLKICEEQIWNGADDYYSISANQIAKKVKELPTLDVVSVRYAKWIYGEDRVAMCDGYRCSNCGFFVPWDYQHKFISYIEEYNYCPSCGAMMVEDD